MNDERSFFSNGVSLCRAYYVNHRSKKVQIYNVASCHIIEHNVIMILSSIIHKLHYLALGWLKNTKDSIKSWKN